MAEPVTEEFCSDYKGDHHFEDGDNQCRCGPDFGTAPKLGSAPCPDCGKFARVTVAGHLTYPDNDWSYTVDCKKCGRRSS